MIASISTKPSGGGSFATLAGSPSDNTALAAALADKLNLAGGTMTGALVNSANGAASTPALQLTGAPFTGGSATTTKPLLLVEPSGTTSTGWSTHGTGIGTNLPSTLNVSARHFSAQQDGVEMAYIRRDGLIHSSFGLQIPNLYNTGGGIVGSIGVNLNDGNSFTSISLIGSLRVCSSQQITGGTSSPEGVVSAKRGSLYMRDNTGTSSGELWLKVSGDGTDTGWINIT